jgi:hypothetical protein
MLVTVNLNDTDIKSETRADLYAVMARRLAEFSSHEADGKVEQAIAPKPISGDATFAGFDLEGVADLTFRQVQKWMERASDKTKNGLRVFAEYGPVVDVGRIYDAGISNVPHFQSRTTIRTRTVTGDKDAYLLGWDDGDDSWEVDHSTGRYLTGRYAVTPITHQSLRRYFGFD